MNPRTRRAGAETRKGFTLMELMVVIAILGLLVTLVAPNILTFLKKGNVTAAKAQIKHFEGAVTSYRMNNGNKLPDSLDVLVQPDPNNFNEVYLDELPMDPWGNPYEYKKLSGSKFEIISLGADGMPGGEGEDEDIGPKKNG